MHRVLGQVQESFDRPLQTRRGKGRYMEPGVHQHLDMDRRKPLNTNSVLWLNLPFFCYEKGTEIELPDGSSSHPMWALLQRLYQSSRTNRDKDQVVCKVTKNDGHYFFHLSQLWCLVIHNCQLSLHHIPLENLESGTNIRSLTHNLRPITYVGSMPKFN